MGCKFGVLIATTADTVLADFAGCRIFICHYRDFLISIFTESCINASSPPPHPDTYTHTPPHPPKPPPLINEARYHSDFLVL